MNISLYWLHIVLTIDHSVDNAMGRVVDAVGREDIQYLNLYINVLHIKYVLLFLLLLPT